MPEYYRSEPYFWNPEGELPSALVPVAQFTVSTPLTRPLLLAGLSRGANNFPNEDIGPDWEWQFLRPSIGEKHIDSVPHTPIPMVICGLANPRQDDPLHILLQQAMDPVARRHRDRNEALFLAERYPVAADEVVAALYQAGLRPATLSEMLALAMHHQLDPQPGLPGWDDFNTPPIMIHALGCCERREEDHDLAGTDVSFVHPVIAIEREISIGRPFVYNLSTASGEYDHRGLMAFGRDFFLAVPR